MVKYLGIKFVFKYKYYIFNFNGRKRSRLVCPYLHLNYQHFIEYLDILYLFYACHWVVYSFHS